MGERFLKPAKRIVRLGHQSLGEQGDGFAQTVLTAFRDQRAGEIDLE
jgi:hypothetical protein